MQAALRTIGEAIVEDEYTTEYQPYYTASPISGSNKAIESVVVVQFERLGDRIEYLGTELIDPEDSPGSDGHQIRLCLFIGQDRQQRHQAFH
jgi:hypothetical protein